MMRCTTCGSELRAGGRVCATCGSPLVLVPRCARCGYRGEGIAFFRRPAHVALLLLFGAFTYGIGALVYWLMRRGHRACPNCGLAWEPEALGVAEFAPATPPSQRRPGVALPPAGGVRRFGGLLAVIVAVVLLSVALATGEGEPAIAGMVMGTGGGLSIAWGIHALRERRRALLAELQRQTLLLAARRGGELTATDVATELSLSLTAAERVLISMDDGYRVRSEITEEGLLLYEFPEIRHREHPRLPESPG